MRKEVNEHRDILINPLHQSFIQQHAAGRELGEEFDEDIVELESPNLSQVSLSPSKQSNVGCTQQNKAITYEAIATQVDKEKQREQRSESRYYCPWCNLITTYKPKAYPACSKCVVLMHA